MAGMGPCSERPEPHALRVCDSAAWYIYIQGRVCANEPMSVFLLISA